MSPGSSCRQTRSWASPPSSGAAASSRMLKNSQAFFSGLLRVMQLLDGTHLDGADAGGWESRGHCARLVHVLGLDEEESAELLLGLGERAVRDGGLAAADPDGAGGPRPLQRVRDDVVAALLDLVAVVDGGIDEVLHLVLGHVVERAFVVEDHEQEFHCLGSLMGREGPGLAMGPISFPTR